MLHSDHDIRNRLLIARLPAMPQILIKLIERLQADDLGMPELAALIASDPGMAAKVLAVANSSAYHRSRSIGLEQALVALGTDMIKLLVIGESVAQTFHNFPHAGSIDLRRFWQHALSAALVARALAQRMQYPQPEEAYLAGLLHNVGRLALLAAAPREYAFNFCARDDESLCAVEQRTLQITHAEAGAWLIERWQLDSFLADAVLYHHEPGTRLAHSHPLIRIVRLAHVLASGDADETQLLDAASLCALAPEEADAIRGGAARQLAQLAAQLGIDLDGASELPPALAARDPSGQRLAEQVGQHALVAEAGQVFARQQGDGALFESIARAARILFSFSNTVMLVDDPAGQRLVGTASCAQQRSAGFAVPLDGSGALAAAARGGQVTLAHAAQPGLAEQQLLRILDSASMACIPLIAGGRCLGLLAGAMAEGPLSGQRAAFMLAFGAQAAAAMEAALAGRGHARRQLAHAADEYRAASRRVAHEVNNPLAIIKNYLGVLDQKLARHENVSGEVAILSEEIDRVGQLINGLAGPDEAPAAVAGIGRVIEDVVRLFRAGGGAVQLMAQVDPDCADALCDSAMLKQVLINLIKNALEAMPAGGQVTLSCHSRSGVAGQRVLAVSVADTGPGLPPQVLANLFAPAAGAGRGLGLSIVHGLVERAGGSISCRSGAAGTVFELLLPAQVEVA